MIKIYGLLVIALLLCSCDSGEQEILIIPKDFTGYILILFNQETGVAPEYHNQKRIYEIPKDGIFKTQFKGNYGNVGFPEFYYEKISPENKLLSFVEMEKVPHDTIVGFRGPVGTLRKSEDSQERIEFVEFYVGNRSQIESAKEMIKTLDLLKLAD